MFSLSGRRSAGGLRRPLPRLGRRGAAAVEFAVVAGPMFLTVFVMVELARGLMVLQALEEAARAACRVAVVQGSTSAQMDEAAQKILAPSGITSGKYTLTTDPSTLSSAQEWQPITVTITASFADTSWLPIPTSLKEATLKGTCTLPREGEEDSGS